MYVGMLMLMSDMYVWCVQESPNMKKVARARPTYHMSASCFSPTTCQRPAQASIDVIIDFVCRVSVSEARVNRHERSA